MKKMWLGLLENEDEDEDDEDEKEERAHNHKHKPERRRSPLATRYALFATILRVKV